MSRHRKPRPKVPQRRAPNLNVGDLIVRSRTSDLLWRVAVAARAVQWAPEMEDCGESAHAVLDDAIDALDAHVRSGGARCSSAAARDGKRRAL